MARPRSVRPRYDPAPSVSCRALARSRLLVGSSSISSCGAGSASISAASVARKRSPPDSVAAALVGAGAPEQEAGQPGADPVVGGVRREPGHVLGDGQLVVEHVEPLRQEPQRHMARASPEPTGQLPGDRPQQRGLARAVARRPARSARARARRTRPALRAVCAARSVAQREHGAARPVRRCTAGRRGSRRRPVRPPRPSSSRSFASASFSSCMMRCLPADTWACALARAHDDLRLALVAPTSSARSASGGPT